MFVTEIYPSVQGESTAAGQPCTFIRLSGCPLRCRWCDTAYSFKQGEPWTMEAILQKVESFGIKMVEVTGGEPLAQPETPELLQRLVLAGYEVLIETSGSESIAGLPAGVRVIMDIKCPGSKMQEHNRYDNIAYLKPTDEVKFVVASREDFDWAVAACRTHELESRCTVLMSPAWGLVDPEDLVNWMLESRLKCRLNLQIHKYIWSPRKRGV